MSTSPDDFFSDEAASDVDSDSPGDDTADYRPISTVDDSDEEDGAGGSSIPTVHSNGGGTIHHRSIDRDAVNGILGSDLNGNDGIGEGEEEDEERQEEEEEREREASIWRAFTEDERRRSAPLAAETAVRVMEAMRGMSFAGFAPDWAGRVSEDEWVGQVRRLRESGPTAHP